MKNSITRKNLINQNLNFNKRVFIKKVMIPRKPRALNNVRIVPIGDL